MSVFDALKKISNGNEDAFRFVWATYLFIQLQDDLIDRDKEVMPEQLVKVNLHFISEIGSNRFYQENQSTLYPHIVSGAMAWVSAEAWAKRENPFEQLVGEVLKSSYQELFFQVAVLVGGLEHAFRMQEAFRSYYPDWPKALSKPED